MSLQTDPTPKAKKNFPLAPGWEPYLGQEFQKPYMNNLRSFLVSEKENGQVFFPPSNNILRSLNLVDYEQVKVVILGQDPYHGKNQANGLAFAVENNVPMPPSLMNICKEIKNNYPQIQNVQRNLENWAKQGVLLLNAVLTVRENQAFSHSGKGWEQFTDEVIQSLNHKKTPVVFLLWGKWAQSKSKFINSSLHKILTAPHPSPLSAHRGFLGCGHFTKANDFLQSHNLTPIDWQ